jgi:PAS domain S-box-containing protein
MSLSPSDTRALVDTDLVGLLKLRHRDIAWINPAVEALSGWSLVDVIGQSSRLLHVDDAAFERFFAAAEALQATGGTHRCALQLRRKDGGVLEVEARLVAPPGPAGDLLCVLHDLTELRRAEAVRLRAAAR